MGSDQISANVEPCARPASKNVPALSVPPAAAVDGHADPSHGRGTLVSRTAAAAPSLPAAQYHRPGPISYALNE